MFPLSKHFILFNVFRYITFRSVYAAVTAFGISLIFGKWFIQKLNSARIGEKIRKDGPPTHARKAGTPSMGGVIILLAFVVSVILWVQIKSPFLWLSIFSILWFGILGFIDDYWKMIGFGKSRGIPGIYKLMFQTLGAIIIVSCYLQILPADFAFKTAITLPFIKIPIFLNQLYPVFAVIVIVGSSNAVNLTDGLDGLAIGCVTFAAMAFAIITYVAGNEKFSQYLKFILIPGADELTVLCAALVGAGLGFLWFNAHPAQIFMGDTGALALGGLLGTIAVMVKQEILLLIVGGIFVAEALSVILQVMSFKMSGKRIFKMAPLHHHFELSGVPESKLIVRFWIIALVLTLLTLSTLKLR